jgi:hypothetical protein
MYSGVQSSVLGQIAYRELQWKFPSCGAHVYMLGARFGVRAAEDGHLTAIGGASGRGRLGRMDAWRVKPVLKMLRMPSPPSSPSPHLGPTFTPHTN